MPDRIDISHGGALAVDTGVLRDLVPRLTDAVSRLDGVARDLGVAQDALRWLPEGFGATFPLWALRGEVLGTSDRLLETCTGVRLMADAYEIVEQRAHLAVLRGGDVRGATLLARELARREADDPDAAALADLLTAQWQDERFAGLVEQAWGVSLLGLHTLFAARALLYGTVRLIDRHGRSPLAPGARLDGAAPPVRVTAVPRVESPKEAPKSVRETFSRIPEGEAQVRVEKYSLPDGTEEFVVYIAGTRSLAGDDPWNMSSNLDLYFGDASASYEAVRQALSAAGAEPGAVVHAVGHSQGGMIAGRLGMEGEYDVRSVLTAGSPVEPALPDSTLIVQLRHTDDIVSSLAGGGSPAGTGSPDSMVVQRVGDPGHGLHDLSLPPHHLERYLDTAGMLDASGDARLGALDQLWTRLTSATAVQATEFAATTRNADRGSAASGR